MVIKHIHTIQRGIPHQVVPCDTMYTKFKVGKINLDISSQSSDDKGLQYKDAWLDLWFPWEKEEKGHLEIKERQSQPTALQPWAGMVDRGQAWWTEARGSPARRLWHKLGEGWCIERDKITQRQKTYY